MIGDGRSEVTFGQGDWTCTLARFTAAANDSTKGPGGDTIRPTSKEFEIELCTIARRKGGELVEEKLFYDLAGMLKQIGVM